tara:strand:- start:1155 stop:1400 length:246 start_codon:yes stop_codon:yes gene_type:complete
VSPASTASGPELSGNLHQSKLIARNLNTHQPELPDFPKFQPQSYLMATLFRLRDDLKINHFIRGFPPFMGKMHPFLKITVG